MTAKMSFDNSIRQFLLCSAIIMLIISKDREGETEFIIMCDRSFRYKRSRPSI